MDRLGATVLTDFVDGNERVGRNDGTSSEVDSLSHHVLPEQSLLLLDQLQYTVSKDQRSLSSQWDCNFVSMSTELS